ncbi:hypothetical protein ACFQZ2_01735 [Streptomonospora algeriensis]|uniref:Uncharacterized protein n=1 Tax=Streptomonospora algeriensis TaxID=995084 RepID=A0ABW3BB94_9ACTN
MTRVKDGDIPPVCVLPEAGARQNVPAVTIDEDSSSVILINPQSTRSEVRAALLKMELNEAQWSAVSPLVADHLDPNECIPRELPTD